MVHVKPCVNHTADGFWWFLFAQEAAAFAKEQDFEVSVLAWAALQFLCLMHLVVLKCIFALDKGH